MNGYAGLLQQGMLIGALIVFLSSVAVSYIYPMAKPRLEQYTPATQAIMTLWACLFPLLAMCAVIFAALLPSLLHLLGLENDHCLGHEAHPHFCLIHRPSLLDSEPVNLIVAVFCLLMSLVILRLLMDIWNSHRFLSRLKQYPCRTNGSERILETSLPLAFACGLIQPKIYLSTGLLEKLTSSEKKMLLTHERAHLQRRDNLKWILARAFAVVHLPGTRKALLQHLQLASEAACDQKALSSQRQRADMASLLLKIENLFRTAFRISEPAILQMLGGHGSTLPARIRTLLSPPSLELPRKTLAITLVLSVLALATGHDLLHSGLEDALSFLHG